MTPLSPSIVAAIGAPILGVALAMSSHAETTLDRAARAEAVASAAQSRAQAAQASRSTARAAAASAQRHTASAAAVKKAAAARIAAKRATTSKAAPRALKGACVAKRSGNSGLRSWPQADRGRISAQFGISAIGGYRPGSGSSDHHDGLALDVMTSGSKGDRVAAWARKNADSLNVSYIIWQQRIWTNGGSGWRAMGDRGGATENHMDHVHISFDSGSGSCPAS